MPTNRSNSTVAASYLIGLVAYVSEQGFSKEQLLQGSGISETQLDETGSRVSASQYIQLFFNAERLCQDPLLGLHVGLRVMPGNYGVMGYMVMACKNFAEALTKAAKYQKLVGDIGYSDVIFENDECQWRWRTPHEGLPVSIAEETLTSCITYSKWITRHDKPPLRINFKHRAPADITPYESSYECPVYFSQPENSIVFPRSYGDIPLPQFDLDLCAWLDKKATQELEDFHSTHEIISRCKSVICNALPDGLPTLEAVASKLSLTERELRNTLNELDLTYKRLLDQARHYLAVGYLGNPQIELNELAFLLGFSEQSAFQRAFKRWTGTTPGKYRKAGR